MEHHVQTRLSIIMIGILFGFPIGCVITLGIVGISQKPVENQRIMKFGDVVVSALIPNDANDQCVEELLMTKDGRSFLLACRNNLGEVTDLTLSNGSEQVILILRASRSPGKWISAQYGPSDLIGELYMDIDFDGQFDTKAIVDCNGRAAERHIYYKGDWKQIDDFQEGKAVSNSETFIFDKDTGWQLEKTGRK